MVTPLQARFSNSGIARFLLRTGLQQQGVNIPKGCRREFNHAAARILNDMPEVWIKWLLHEFISCYDVTPAQKAEAKKLLQLSKTALTRDQIPYFTGEKGGK